MSAKERARPSIKIAGKAKSKKPQRRKSTDLFLLSIPIQISQPGRDLPSLTSPPQIELWQHSLGIQAACQLLLEATNKSPGRFATYPQAIQRLHEIQRRFSGDIIGMIIT